MASREEIVFGGGCFWCIEAVFQMLRGVESVESGYAGGTVASPSYEQVSSESTGHAEVVKVQFDPNVISLKDLLAVFFTVHDPTTLNRQGNDRGAQYRSAIYFTNTKQQHDIEKFIANLEADKVFPNPILTEVKPLKVFYSAEQYHQNYYRNNTDQPYCQVVINPKVQKLREQFSKFLKPF